MGELVELIVLIAISLILVVGVIFRPTTVDISRKKLAVSAREETARDVLGPTPTREASQIYRKLLSDAHHLGVTINWEEARSEQMTVRPQRSLVAAARNQISRGV